MEGKEIEKVLSVLSDIRVFEAKKDSNRKKRRNIKKRRLINTQENRQSQMRCQSY